jgi:hypothetical protein
LCPTAVRPGAGYTDLIWKLIELRRAGPDWRSRDDGHNQLPKLILGVKFTGGLDVLAKWAIR